MDPSSDSVPGMCNETTKSTSEPATHAPVDLKINRTSSLQYWNDVPATSTGMLAMLGGYPWYSRIELRGSKSFLAKVRRVVPACPTTGKLKQGVDCGSGIGRVTEGFLSQVCEVVDQVEPIEKFTQTVRDGQLKRDGVVGDIYTMGLEDWIPDKKYDLIWTQWCVGHLTDAQLLNHIERCRMALTETGIMVIKENMSTDPHGNDMYDDVDSSVTRTDEKFRNLFKEAEMNLITTELQSGFPKNYKLLPVRFYALRPKK